MKKHPPRLQNVKLNHIKHKDSMDFFDHDMIPCYEIIVALDVDIKTFGYNIKDTIISKISPVKKLWFDIRFISRIFSIYKYTYIYTCSWKTFFYSSGLYISLHYRWDSIWNLNLKIFLQELFSFIACFRNYFPRTVLFITYFFIIMTTDSIKLFLSFEFSYQPH